MWKDKKTGPKWPWSKCPSIASPYRVNWCLCFKTRLRAKPRLYETNRNLLTRQVSKHSLTFRRRLLWFIDFRQFSGSHWIGENHSWMTPRRGDWWSRMEAVCYLRGVGRNGACNFDHQSVTSSKSEETTQWQSGTHWERKIPSLTLWLLQIYSLIVNSGNLKTLKLTILLFRTSVKFSLK